MSRNFIFQTHFFKVRCDLLRCTFRWADHSSWTSGWLFSKGIHEFETFIFFCRVVK